METIKILEDEIKSLQKSIESGADGWETIILLHEKLIKCIELHAKITS